MSININFKDYLSARTHVWVTGSVRATFNNTEYVRAEDSHGIRDCDKSLPGDLCQQCVVAFNTKYGIPKVVEPPKVVEFDWYLHGNSMWEQRDFLSQQVGFTVSDELLEKIGRPFYEIGLRCSLDTETGEVKILSAK